MENDTSLVVIIMTGVTSVVATVALVISVISFYSSHISPFAPSWNVSNLELRMFPIHSKSETWCIASAYVPVSATNGGKKPGLVALRMEVTDPERPKLKEYWDARFQIDDPALLRSAHGFSRGTWIDLVNRRHFSPISIMPDGYISSHVVFEQRLNGPEFGRSIHFRLEQLTIGKKEWVKLAEWHFVVDEWSIKQMLGGSSFTNHSVAHWGDAYSYDNQPHSILFGGNWSDLGFPNQDEDNDS